MAAITFTSGKVEVLLYMYYIHVHSTAVVGNLLFVCTYSIHYNVMYVFTHLFRFLMLNYIFITHLKNCLGAMV